MTQCDHWGAPDDQPVRACAADPLPLTALSVLQVPEPPGDVYSHCCGVVHLPGLSVGRREQGRDQQLQEAEPHSICVGCHGGQLHLDLSAGERHGVYVCNHLPPHL